MEAIVVVMCVLVRTPIFHLYQWIHVSSCTVDRCCAHGPGTFWMFHDILWEMEVWHLDQNTILTLQRMLEECSVAT